MTRGPAPAEASIPAGRPINPSPDAPAEHRRARGLLVKYLGARAGAEALFHAFLAERNLNRPAARFWIGVYGMIVGERE